MKFVYPVDINEKDDAACKYLKGASNRTGYYPIGRMNTWHGGVHFQGDKPIRVIADGKIIAFRVPQAYFKEVIGGRQGQYSNGFVLVQHDYESPKGQKLTFYSLYNHLTSFEEMKGNKIPDIFKGEIYKVSKEVKETIDTNGVRIRYSPEDGAIIGVAAKGTTLAILGNSTRANWISVRYTTPLGKVLNGHTFRGKDGADPWVDPKTGKVLIEAASGPTGDVGARLLKKPNAKSEILALIPPEETLEIAPESIGKTGWLKVLNYGSDKMEGYCDSKSLEKEAIVTLTDELCNEVNNVCMEVKAGTVIGFAGLNGFEKHEAYRAAHLEVFTTDDVKGFLANSQKDGDNKKHYAKLAAGTELKAFLPIKVAKNSKVKLLSGSSETYQKVEVLNIELTIYDRDEALGDYTSDNNSYEFLDTQSDRVAEFNKVAGDIAKIGDKVELLKELEGKKRDVRHINPASGQVFWVKKEMIEKKVITYTVPQEEDESEGLGEGVDPVFANTPAGRSLSATATLIEPVTETIEYDVLNADLTKIHILNPETSDKDSRTLESEVIVNYKNGTEYSDSDGNKWCLLDFKELKPNGVARCYKGLVKEADLADTFSAYDWEKFGFRVLEDPNNDYIYDFDNKSEFFTEICKLVDKDKNGVIEPHELQSALNNHYTADQLSKLVCKHHSEWAYGGQYYNALASKVEEVLQKGIDLEEDEERQQELTTLKKERLEAFEAKVKQLAIWEKIEARKSSYASKIVKGALITNPVTAGGYLTYEGVKWIYRKLASGDEPDKQIPLSPFPISNPVVYHFHPVAFVEGMKRHYDCCSSNWSFDLLKLIAHKSNDSNIENHLSGLNKSFKDNEINSCLRKIHFLAQVLHESGGLKYTREIGVSDDAYGGYPGRGLIQLTGEANSKAYQNFSGEDVTSGINCKMKLEQNPHASVPYGKSS